MLKQDGGCSCIYIYMLDALPATYMTVISSLLTIVYTVIALVGS